MRLAVYLLVLASSRLSLAEDLSVEDDEVLAGYLPPSRPHANLIPLGKPAIDVVVTQAVKVPAAIPEAPCSDVCPWNYEPVCGSDGVTYTNNCTFSVAACRDPSLARTHDGRCGAIPAQQVTDAPVVAPEEPLPAAPQQPSTPPAVIPYPPPEFGANDEFGSPTFDLDPDTPAQPAGAPCPLACTRIYQPTCGTDGVTYNNKCLLEIAACQTQNTLNPVQFAFEGTCESLSAVLGEALAGTSVDTGEAPRAPPTCDESCTKIFLPVCGSDGNTYNNECILNVAVCQHEQRGLFLTKSHDGHCDVAKAQPESGDAVASVGSPSGSSVDVTGGLSPPHQEPSLGPLLDTFTDFANQAPAPNFENCPEMCNRAFLPVCGSDGETYNNECILQVAVCRAAARGTELYKAADGPCASVPQLPVPVDPQPEPCPEFCITLYTPVCGTDGVTYGNDCELSRADCVARSSGAAAITKAFDGPCKGSLQPESFTTADPSLVPDAGLTCPEFCNTAFAPVCGTDSVTYSNECQLSQAACRARGAGVSITKAFDGPCVAQLPQGPVCDHMCDASFSPVCGSDGETYNNACLLTLADCLSPFTAITQVSHGACGNVNQATQGEAAFSPETTAGPDTPSHGQTSPDTAVYGGYLPPV